MNDLPCQKLYEIIARYGRSLCDDPRRCEALLRDLCGEYRREISVLVNALKERVAADLLTASDGVPQEVLLARLTKRLHENLALTEEAARWAVESWALALGKFSSANYEAERTKPKEKLSGQARVEIPEADVERILQEELKKRGVVDQSASGFQASTTTPPLPPTPATSQTVHSWQPSPPSRRRTPAYSPPNPLAKRSSPIQQGPAQNAFKGSAKAALVRIFGSSAVLLGVFFLFALSQRGPSPIVSAPKIPLLNPLTTAPTPGTPTQTTSTTRPSRIQKGGEQDYIQQMISYAMSEGGINNEAEILGAKRKIEELNLRPPRGDRKRAREYNEKGLECTRGWRFAEAVQAFQEAYQADPADIEIINNLGHVYMKDGDVDMAERFLFQALAFASDRSSAWADLGQLYAKKDNLSASVACFANAYRFSRKRESTVQFFQNLAKDGNAQEKEAANRVLQLKLIQNEREKFATREPEAEPRVASESPLSPGRYEVVRSTPLFREPRSDSDVITWLDSETKVNITEATGDYLKVESKRGKAPGYIARKDVKPAPAAPPSPPSSSSAVPSDTATASLPTTTDVAATGHRPERFGSPLTVAVFPLEALGGTRRYSIERASYETLTKYLLESGRYSVLDSRQLGRRGYSRQGSAESWACETARNKGAKIAVLGTISDFDLTRDTPPVTWFGSREFGSRLSRSFYKVSLRASIRLFATRDCQLIDTLTRSGTRQQVPNRDRDAAVRQVIDEVFQQLTQNVNASLMD